MLLLSILVNGPGFKLMSPAGVEINQKYKVYTCFKNV